MSFNPPAGSTKEQIDAHTAAMKARFGLQTPKSHEDELQELFNREKSHTLPNGHTAYDYREAISGKDDGVFGTLGYDWVDKPHRLVYDLLRVIDMYRQKLDVLEGKPNAMTHTYSDLGGYEPRESEAVRIFKMNRGDFEKECRDRGLDPLDFASWLRL
jgi:hypothetical protein